METPITRLSLKAGIWRWRHWNSTSPSNCPKGENLNNYRKSILYQTNHDHVGLVVQEFYTKKKNDIPSSGAAFTWFASCLLSPSPGSLITSNEFERNLQEITLLRTIQGIYFEWNNVKYCFFSGPWGRTRRHEGAIAINETKWCRFFYNKQMKGGVSEMSSAIHSIYSVQMSQLQTRIVCLNNYGESGLYQNNHEHVGLVVQEFSTKKKNDSSSSGAAFTWFDPCLLSPLPGSLINAKNLLQCKYHEWK